MVEALEGDHLHVNGTMFMLRESMIGRFRHELWEMVFAKTGKKIHLPSELVVPDKPKSMETLVHELWKLLEAEKNPL